jgi:predicted RNase H-like nuclease
MGMLGVDACRKGWAGIVLSTDSVPCGVFAPTLVDVVARAQALAPLDVIAVDMPIGLPDAGRRAADVEAKRLAGPRRSSVFIAPVRPAAEAATYADAARINREMAGEGLSAQAYALVPRIIEVDMWVHIAGITVVEVHPELSFAAMADGPVPVSKHTWAGAMERRRRLDEVGIHLPDNLGEVGSSAGVDDVLDAAAAAWTARRYLTGRAVSVPAQPETFSDGWPAAIWR